MAHGGTFVGRVTLGGWLVALIRGSRTMKRLKRIALAASVAIGCVSIIGASVEIDRAQAADYAPQARGAAPAPSYAVPPPPSVQSSPAPNFNPSSPYTVPQSGETPVSPETPGSGPGER
jgi:hypothetical protein